MDNARAQRNYKDTMFRMLFSEKEELLSLYNAVNQTSHIDPESLTVTTLENAVYMNYKNDISFVFDFELMLYEHQSTVNPNMPLRDLLYVTRIIQGLIKDEDLFGSQRINIPAPRFVVFYNGVKPQPRKRILRLSEAYGRKSDIQELELTVTVYNINLGYNPRLLKACKLLGEYARYVAKVRKYAKRKPFSEAVEQAIDDCIKHDILAEFLSKNRAEVVAMSIFEYNEELHLKNERDISYRRGHDEGLREGRNVVAESMIKAHEPGNKIMLYTGLDSEDVNYLAKKLNIPLEWD